MATKKETNRETGKSGKDTIVTEKKVKEMIDSSVSKAVSGVDELKDTVKEFMEIVRQSSTTIRVPVDTDEVPDLPEPPETSENTEDSKPLDNKEEVEISSRSLAGTIRENGVTWNMFVVSLIIAITLAAIMTSMYFLNTSLEVYPLEMEFPQELEYKDVTEIETGLSGNALVSVVNEEKPIKWEYRDGRLCLNPKAEGKYSIFVTIASGRKVHAGYFTFDSVDGAGDNKFASLAEEVKQAVESSVPTEERSFCKRIGDNYREIAGNKPESLEEFSDAIRDKNRDTLGFKLKTQKLKNESNWFNLLKSGGPISDIIIKYAGVNPTRETIYRILIAVSDGFYAVEC